MSYRILKSDHDLTAALRRIADEQISAAIADTKRPLSEADAAVHDIRKHCKKLRGLYRLMRSGFADYDLENAAARDAARMSSSLRDSGVLLKTFDALLTESDPAPYATLRAALGGETQEAISPEEISAAFARQRKTLKAMRKRSRKWKVEGNGRKVLRAGLSKTWHQADKAMQACREAPDAEAFHEWCKRIKDHWYHSRLLQGFWPGPIREHRDTVKTLSEYLGDHHDLTVFLKWLEGSGLSEAAADLRKRASARQTELADASHALAGPLFKGGPDALPALWSERMRHRVAR